MKKKTQEQQMISMMKRPIPKKKVGIIKLKMVREGTALYGTERLSQRSGQFGAAPVSIFRQRNVGGNVAGYGAYTDCIGERGGRQYQCVRSRYA